MESKNVLIPPAVTPSTPARPIASRTKKPVDSPALAALLWLVAATLITGSNGCSDSLPSQGGARHVAVADRSARDDSAASARNTEHAGRMLYDSLLKSQGHSEGRALRVVVDVARNRLWVLSLKSVHIYDINAKQLIRRVAMPEWSVAGIICSPDLTLDRSGSAFISSNVEPKLWKIDGEDFSIKQHEIILKAREGWDIGFGALTVAADGTLFALTAHAGSLWRIDTAQWRADEVKLSEPVLNTCGLRASFPDAQSTQRGSIALCAGAGRGSRRIAISPDLTRALVSNETCPS